MINTDEIVVLILSTKDERYHDFKLAIEKSWMKDFNNRKIKCFFYEGGHSHNEIVGNLIKINTNDDLKSTAVKMLKAFNLVLNKYPETKLIYRTNLSSYIDIDNFLNFIKFKNINENSYSGVIGETNFLKEYFYGNRFLTIFFSYINISNKINFASGSGFFIGVQNIEKLLSKPMYTNFIDDVMVGYNLKNLLNLNDVPLRFDIRENNKHKISNNSYLKLINLENLFHYRFKTKNRKLDSQLLYNFKDKIFRSNYCTFTEL